MPRLPLDLSRSPLTDPRSLGGSLLFHAAVLFAASLAVLRAAMPAGPTELRPVLGSLGPVVDNRAPAKDAGGSPGALGATDTEPPASIAAEAPPGADGGDDAAAEALLAEALPDIADVPILPGAPSTGVGVLPGPGTGGGGGSGGGSGGGTGKGIGPGTEFFGARENASSFAYVIDCSGSMANRNSLEVAKRELMASLARLPPDARFGVVFYNLRPTTFTDESGRPGLMPATAVNKERVRSRLAQITPDGGTDHMQALAAGLDLKSEVIFFLTDADLMTRYDAEKIENRSGDTRIQAIEFGVGPDLGTSLPLRNLARTTGGSYRYIDVMKFRVR